MSNKTKKMNPEWKAKWTAALRSGEYKQGVLALASVINDGGCISETYCCLGVLCEVVAEEIPAVMVIKPEPAEGTMALATYDDKDCLLPDSVMRIVGLDNSTGWIWVDTAVDGEDTVCGQIQLSQLNDTERWDFNRIADLIEEKL